MNYTTFLNRYCEELKNLYPVGECTSIYFIVLNDVLNLSRKDYTLQKNEIIRDSDCKILESILTALKEGKPVQYITGFTFFCGLKIEVNKDVLIPRPETEELVSWIIEENKFSHPVIADYCTGSGCIALALKNKLKESDCYGFDVSVPAMNIAKNNSLKLNLPVEIIYCDVMDSIPTLNTDIIVSNPPYVLYSEQKEMRKNVLDFEPHLALFAPDSDPIVFFKKIALAGINNLNPGGKIYFEINEKYANQICQMLVEFEYSGVQIRKDLFGKDRFVSANRLK